MKRARLGSVTSNLLCLVLGSALCGCALVRGRAEPAPPMRTAASVHIAEDIHLAAEDWPDVRWWTRYHDPQLNHLIEFALSRAPTIEAARRQVDDAQSQLDAVKSATRLQAAALGLLDETHVSANGFLGPYALEMPQFGLTGPWYTQGIVGVGARYSLDLWGRQRSEVSAAIGARNAQRAERAAVELLVATSVAQLYFEIQTMLHQEQLLDQARDIAQTAVASHEAHVARGLETSTPLAASRAVLLQIEQQITLTHAQVREWREALRALIGADAGDLRTIVIAPLPASHLDIPSKLPSELLARRPDLQVLRWYVQSSVNAIDAAKAAFYPSFDIKAFFGLDALHLSELARASSGQLNVIPGLTLPIFDGGRLNANLRHARAANATLIEQYNQAVLDAVRDVAVAGVQLQALGDRRSLMTERLHQIELLAASAEAHYHRGLASRADAMTARLPVISQEAELLAVQGRQIDEQIRLIQALGGGYSAEQD